MPIGNADRSTAQSSWFERFGHVALVAGRAEIALMRIIGGVTGIARSRKRDFLAD